MTPSPTTILHTSLIGLAALAGALGAGIWGASQPDRYSASTTVAIAPAPSLTDDADVIDVVGGLDRGTIVETLAGLVTSAPVVSAAAEEVAIPGSDRGLYDVSAVRVTGASLVDVTASGPDPELVAALATAAATTAAAEFDTLYRVYVVDVVAAADVPDASDRPSVLVVTTAGAVVAGLAAAIVVAASRSRRRERHLAAVGDPSEQRHAS